MGGEFQLLGRLGTETQSLLAEGMTIATGFELGWLFRLWQNERMMLSGSLMVVRDSFTSVDLLRFIGGVIESGEILPGNKLVSTTPSIRGGGGLRYAYGINDLIGLTAFAETGYGESVNREAEDEWFLEFGGALSINLIERTSLPLGFLLGYNQNSFPLIESEESLTTREVSFKIAYSGTPDFSIGVESFYTRIRPQSFDEPIKSVGALISMRYYF